MKCNNYSYNKDGNRLQLHRAFTPLLLQQGLAHLIVWPRGQRRVFTMTLKTLSEFNLHTGHVVASLDKTLYNDYLRLVRTSNKFRGQVFEETHSRSIGSLDTPKQVGITAQQNFENLGRLTLNDGPML